MALCQRFWSFFSMGVLFLTIVNGGASGGCKRCTSVARRGRVSPRNVGNGHVELQFVRHTLPPATRIPGKVARTFTARAFHARQRGKGFLAKGDIREGKVATEGGSAMVNMRASVGSFAGVFGRRASITRDIIFALTHDARGNGVLLTLLHRREGNLNRIINFLFNGTIRRVSMAPTILHQREISIASGRIERVPLKCVDIHDSVTADRVEDEDRCVPEGSNYEVVAINRGRNVGAHTSQTRNRTYPNFTRIRPEFTLFDTVPIVVDPIFFRRLRPLTMSRMYCRNVGGVGKNYGMRFLMGVRSNARRVGSRPRPPLLCGFLNRRPRTSRARDHNGEVGPERVAIHRTSRCPHGGRGSRGNYPCRRHSFPPSRQ